MLIICDLLTLWRLWRDVLLGSLIFLNMRRMRLDSRTLLCRSRTYLIHLEEEQYNLFSHAKFNQRWQLSMTFIVSILGLLKHDGYLDGWTVFFWSLLFLSSFGFSTSSRIYLVIVIIWFLHPEQIVISTKGFVDISYKIGLSAVKEFPLR